MHVLTKSEAHTITGCKNKMARTIRTKVYKFDELNETAKQKAINDRIDDMVNYESADHYENWPEFKKAVDKAEEMQTPWFIHSYIFDFCGKSIIDALIENKECIYTKDGDYFNC